MNAFSPEELKRYSRHYVLPEVGIKGQQKLKSARVLIVGAGGLSSPAALYLTAAGVGTIGIVDDDRVDASNLQRQLLHSTSAIGTPKVHSAKERIQQLNPLVQVKTYETRLTSSNALAILRDYDIIIDGSDNFPTRYLINDACIMLKKPDVFGSIFRFEGQVSLFGVDEGPCYRCVYPEPPPPHLVRSCAESGVLGILPGVIGTIQATETLKWIVGIGQGLVGRMLFFDALRMNFQQLQLKRNPSCPVCGENPEITELIDYDQFCGKSSGQNEGISVRELKDRLDRGESVTILDVREPEEYNIANIGGQLIPLNELPGRFEELDRQGEIVVLCHHGIRSADAAQYLRRMGFAHVKNLEGGIDAWSTEVDHRLTRY